MGIDALAVEAVSAAEGADLLVHGFDADGAVGQFVESGVVVLFTLCFD